jgi:hypothetical protein
MKEFRCQKCNKLLGKIDGTAEIVCPRCKEENTTSPPRLGGLRHVKPCDIINLHTVLNDRAFAEVFNSKGLSFDKNDPNWVLKLLMDIRIARYQIFDSGDGALPVRLEKANNLVKTEPLQWSARIADKGEPLRVTITPSEIQNETKPITVESLNAAIEALKKASEPPPFECLWLIYNTDEQRERYEAYFGDKINYIKSPGYYTEKPALYLKP